MADISGCRFLCVEFSKLSITRICTEGEGGREGGRREGAREEGGSEGGGRERL